MKKVKCAAALLAAAMLALMVTGCSGKCKENGCEEDATKDGYCDIHYAAHAVADALEGLF